MDHAPATTDAELLESDALRARHWGLLARLLAAPPDAGLLAGLGGLAGDEAPLGRAYQALADAARIADPQAVAREYFELFVGVGRGELLPYGSFYLTGFLNERPLAELRADLARMGLEAAEGRHEPEDHIASLCEIMAGLAAEEFGAPGGEAAFFARHVAPWAGAFFADLGKAPGAIFYRRVAEIGRLFIEIETRAFALAREERR